MTTRADFTEEEWDLVREGPPAAGLLVSTAERGGTFRPFLLRGDGHSSVGNKTRRGRPGAQRAKRRRLDGYARP